MARLGILIIVSWIFTVFLILGAEVCRTETEPRVQPNVADSFADDVRDILDLLRMFISLIETVNSRIGRALKLQPDIATPGKDLETESMEELFNRFEIACRSFRIRFQKFMQNHNVISDSRLPDNVNERLSNFERSVVDTYLDGFDDGTKFTTSFSESTTGKADEDVNFEASGELLENENEPSSPVSMADDAEGKRTDSWTQEDEVSSGESADYLEERVTSTENEPSIEYVIDETEVTNDDSSTVNLVEETEINDNESTTESIVDDNEVTVEEDESPTEPLIDETELSKGVTESSTTDTITTEVSSGNLDNAEFSSDLDSTNKSDDFPSEEDHNPAESASPLEQKTEPKEYFPFRPKFRESNRRPLLVSMIGAPGKHFPNYSIMPETSFSCEDKKYIPGVYADLETKCQVFHVCWPHKVESFLCPIGTIFNQQSQTCDYWFSSTCSLSPGHFSLNKDLFERLKPVDSDSIVDSAIAFELKKLNSPTLFLISKMKFMPIHFESTNFPKIKIPMEHPEWNELENPFLTNSKDSSFSKLELDFARKIYSELFRSPNDFDSERVDEPSALDSLFHKMKLQERRDMYEKSSIKSDRSGLMAEMESEENPDQVTTETANSSETEQPQILPKKPIFKFKYPHSDIAKDQIAPVIVFKVLETAENVLNDGILPLTREMLAASYSKLPKRKKL